MKVYHQELVGKKNGEFKGLLNVFRLEETEDCWNLEVGESKDYNDRTYEDDKNKAIIKRVS